MDFYGIIKKINELRKDLGQVILSDIEKDILKSKISETYLLLFEEQEVTSYSMVEQPPVSMVEQPPVQAPVQPPVQKEPVVEEKKQPLPFNVDYKSLVDAFLEKEPAKQVFPEDQSVLSKISQTKIIDLKRSIAMNDRFIFIKELFKNDFDSYNRYINDLNACETMQQAEQHLTQLKRQYEWDEANETVQYFLTLVGRKFN